jgi:hypothetical protein
MNAGDFREIVVRPALKAVDLWSEFAEELLMGTAAQESQFEALEQKRGPALGVFQIEPKTHQDLYASYLTYRPELEDKALYWSSSHRRGRAPDDDELAWNLRYAAVICRLVYYRRPRPMPSAVTPNALAECWKTDYNTNLGDGTREQFLANYQRLVAGHSAID